MGVTGVRGWKVAERWLGARAGVDIRAERADEVAGIRELTTAVFAGEPHSGGNEAQIVDGLRAAGALTLSLIALRNEELIGHAAFSPVAIAGQVEGWFGLGPVSVRPDA
jgi:putative acetyltransferase